MKLFLAIFLALLVGGLAKCKKKLTIRATEMDSYSPSGIAPTYKEPSKGSAAINCLIPAYADKWGGAMITLKKLPCGKKKLKVCAHLHSVLEEDGESPYRLVRDGKVLGQYRNRALKAGEHDGRKYIKKIGCFKAKKGDKLVVESKCHTNGKVPEPLPGKPENTATSRGRWTKLVLSRKK